jgi:hypothetical protein
MGHRRDVRGGDLRMSSASGTSRRQESAGGGQRVWPFARHSTEDAAVRGAAKLPSTAADQAAQVGAMIGRYRCHSEQHDSRCELRRENDTRISTDSIGLKFRVIRSDDKQRHTAKRIFERLKEGELYT